MKEVLNHLLIDFPTAIGNDGCVGTLSKVDRMIEQHQIDKQTKFGVDCIIPHRDIIILVYF